MPMVPNIISNVLGIYRLCGPHYFTHRKEIRRIVFKTLLSTPQFFIALSIFLDCAGLFHGLFNVEH